MIRITDDVVRFKCTCGTTIQGSANDALIKSFSAGNEQIMTQINQQLVKNSTYDRTNNIIPVPCTKCGLPYKTQVKIGEDDIIMIALCKCE
jgi:hypothetical protein